ncbi:MAG TPA: type II toxin-antitoxin system PemK/MazF family toxin [Acidimicrobiales bacterium]|nr:type II toxin-antitoxin system PemK/MazF family toxin [Acidimicrobiales bacterium]
MRRGDVVELRLPKGVGSEQRGRRFGVIVQSDALLPRSVVLIAPTSTAARDATVRPVIEILGDRTKVLVEQLAALDVSRLGETVMTVHGDTMWSIDDALELVLGLN